MFLNVFSSNWDEHRSTPGYAWSRTGVGRRLKGEWLGASLYQLPLEATATCGICTAQLYGGALSACAA